MREAKQSPCQFNKTDIIQCTKYSFVEIATVKSRIKVNKMTHVANTHPHDQRKTVISDFGTTFAW